MHLLAKSDLIALQRDLEESLTRFAESELREAMTEVTEPAVYEAACRKRMRFMAQVAGTRDRLADDARRCNAFELLAVFAGKIGEDISALPTRISPG
ncbi:MAG: hypothetical protein ACRDSR_03045 [Pseudonocardiaceae bacterium]